MGTNSSEYMQIIENIHKELMTCELSENIGLHSGTSGIALFFAYYSRVILKKNEIYYRVTEILEHNIECINSGNYLHTICNGISGFGWLCEHLKKLCILNKEDVKFLDDLDFYLYRKMMTDIKQGNYDYLHGALGVATYFLSRFDKKEILLYLDDLLTELELSGVESENGAVKWISVLNQVTGEKGYNICLSHGMSSIAAFLIRLHQMNFETKRVDKLLTQTVIYILAQITYTEGAISYFPSTSIESSHGNYSSRLGWCYGDLGIAHILWQAAVVLKNKKYESTAIQILRHTSNRFDLQANGIRDAGLCHGSAGVAHVFWNLFLKTGQKEFKESTDYFIDITMQMNKYDDGLAGFKAWNKDEHGGPTKSASLLEGIAGIGIVLLSRLTEGEIAWDECIMLS